jgi:hypothetical protein
MNELVKKEKENLLYDGRGHEGKGVFSLSFSLRA